MCFYLILFVIVGKKRANYFVFVIIVFVKLQIKTLINNNNN